MAGIYTDNDVPLRVAPLLRARGHGVTPTRDLGRSAALDDDQLLLAAQRGWTLVTHNRKDYELLHDAWRRWFSAFAVAATHAGILILPHRDRRCRQGRSPRKSMRCSQPGLRSRMSSIAGSD